MNVFVTIVGRIANLTCSNIPQENNHKHVSFEDFLILRNGYTNNKSKRKIAEALFIKELRLLLNTQETSVALLLCND